MSTIYLNNNEFEINGYNRYTTLVDGKLNSYADVQFNTVDDYPTLLSLVGVELTSIRIVANETTIYNSGLVNANITRVNENLYNDKMNISAQIVFNMLAE